MITWSTNDRCFLSLIIIHFISVCCLLALLRTMQYNVKYIGEIGYQLLLAISMWFIVLFTVKKNLLYVFVDLVFQLKDISFYFLVHEEFLIILLLILLQSFNIIINSHFYIKIGSSLPFSFFSSFVMPVKHMLKFLDLVSVAFL